ncbi:beach-domain-containing protein [Wolfiporia cocos MD-104 SS10]|uniref:Beach-domain-containing protein n=1 Tax=Wolfiporia cocos (strain MD-104) TaxID=742152 RepID=A0A2H3JHI6_WOLCO|nr:beach-domain-containing protein [Wolfiporia cocos MD-104 SS10]
MFRTLLTPLSTRFAISPLLSNPDSAQQEHGAEDELAPEDFARDVLNEVMRNSVERLKFADTLELRTEVLMEIHKIMLEDSRTKDVFREMDGFIVVMNALSTIHVVAGTSEEVKMETLETTRLVFVILSEALFQHVENTEYFQHSVGYESLAQAMSSLVSDPGTVRHTLGFLLSLALHKFAMSGIFEFGSDAEYATLDQRIRDFEPAFGPVHLPGTLLVLFNFIPIVSSTMPMMRYAILKTLERLAHHNHRNHCILSGLGLAEPLFEQYCDWKDDKRIAKQERQLVQRLLRRLVDVGTTTDEARLMFQRVVRSDETLNADVLEIIRTSMKVRWPEHFSIEAPAALRICQDEMRGLPSGGFTFMIWLWIEKFPTNRTHAIYSCQLNDRTLIALGLRPDGSFQLQSSGSHEVALLQGRIVKSRWTHITIIHHPHRTANPTIRLFVDGILTDALNWQYPRSSTFSSPGAYEVGDSSAIEPLSWSVASAYLLCTPLGDSLPRFIHHLGPRYTGRFQTIELLRFFTYEAATALHIYVDGAAQQPATRGEVTQLQRAVKDGLGINEASILFALTPSTPLSSHDDNGPQRIVSEGDVFVVKSTALDLAMWKIGGAAVALRLVQLANSAHEVSRAIGILADGLRNSWQNSEDMERLRGYDILAGILRSKSQFINMTGFETLFEFLGLNFRTPDHSTIVNAVAYRALALDFNLWSSTKSEIQRMHMEHFSTLLQVSKYKRFIARQRMAKMGVIRKLLFVLQTSLYGNDMLDILVETIKIVAQAHFTPDDAIRPIVSYLAANLHEVPNEATSPGSVNPRIDYDTAYNKAERVLKMFISTLHSSVAFKKLSSSIPITRMSLLLLGERPSPATATQILRLIGISLSVSHSFSNKFEMVSGWSILKAVLPHAWDREVQGAAFDVLFGGSNDRTGTLAVVCPQILPAIFSSLKLNLDKLSSQLTSGTISESTDVDGAIEDLLEQLISFHSTVPSFRHIFKSQTATQAFIDTYRPFVVSLSMAGELPLKHKRIAEKISHLGCSIALDKTVSESQKQEIMDIVKSADKALDPQTSHETMIDSAVVLGVKARSRHMASMRLSVQLGEGTVKRSISRIQDWRKSVVETERKRLRKTVLDLREYHRQVSDMTDWVVSLSIERGLWSDPSRKRHWQLDDTEGPYRVRKKLEAIHEVASTKVDMHVSPDPKIADGEPQSALHIEVPPWAESYEVSSTMADDIQLNEEIQDDKHRRIRHQLEPGDVIEATYTVARISGVDSAPGLLIFGHTHLYMLDGVVQDDNGEVVDARDAPKRLFFVPGSIVELSGPQRAQRWSHDQIVTYSDRAFLFRDVALEIYFKDSTSLLVVFLEKHSRQAMNDRLASLVYRLSAEQPTPSPGLLKSPLLSPMMGRLSGKLSATLGAKVLSGLKLDELSTAQRKWQAREISNFTYLSILNQISGRTPSDATQYPVFPWVLSDYSSPALDLNSESSFRDLTRPMGALTPARQEAAISRYAALESVGEKPFHYGTHFSSSMIVCHFLIRLEPFSHMFKTLQGGDWDLPDRLFSDVRRAYESASQDVRGDVRELIPEFYSLPEFLENSAGIDFGVQQSTGERIDNAKLPPWAKQDPLLFIVMNRAALESDYVSQNLPYWIDLIWGYKQRDPASLNVFHPLSYEGSIDLDKISDELEREATVGIIHNFGQTPRRLFHAPHPERMMHGNSALPLGTLYGIAEDYHLLSQSARVVKDLGCPVHELVYDPISQRIIPCSQGMLCVPAHPHESIEWDITAESGGDIKVLIDHKVVQVVESAACSCAAFADANTLVTGSSDHTVRLWRVFRGSSHAFHRHRDHPLSIAPTHIMRGHTAEVVCVTASRAWSMVVSGSKDGSAVIWDLNRGTYVRSIWHGPGQSTEVGLVAINESTGYIASCSKRYLCLHTINGRPIVMLDLHAPSAPRQYACITALAFLEREYARVGVLATGAPDGTITLSTWNADATPASERARWEFAVLRTLHVKDTDGGVQPRECASRVTALKFVGESLYHGEDTGRVFSWDLPD